MRPIVIVLIVLALGLAGIIAFLASQWLASQKVPEQAQTTSVQVNIENVLVAARDITPGTILTADDIKWEPWPSNYVDQERFVVQPKVAQGQAPGPDPQQDFLDRIAKRSIMSGEPMSRDMVLKQGDSSVTAANLAAGMRAITINVSPSSGVAGLVLPNDHVDVIMNTSVRDLVQLDGWKDVVLRYASETVLKNVRVVAINQKLSHDPKTGVAEPGNLVTLELKPDQAERIRVAEQLGQLSLSLRSMVPGLNDSDKQQTYVMDVRASRALSSLVALDLNENEEDLPQTTQQAIAKAKERAARQTEVKINRGGAVAIQKFGQ
ncbi:MAG TPA: Flp pilus assembly protein CpaB [Candidatus Cybelea sp.]|nr:Flp pilus assembly protein CpaB [Candidatus Cybelea sp.]